jgi:integrase
VRFVPLMAGTVALLRFHLRAHGLEQPESADLPLFQGRAGCPLSKSGLRYLLQKYARSAKMQQPSLVRYEHIGPHCIRHSKAMHLLEADVHPIHIRDLLGHEDVKTTTDIYARASIKMKKRVLERASTNSMQPSESKLDAWRQDRELLAWLRAL